MADQYGDLKLAYLEAQTLETGQTNDLELSWLQSLTLDLTNDLNDQWHLYMDSLLIPAGALNDRQSEWLSGLGHTQPTLNEQFMSFYSTT